MQSEIIILDSSFSALDRNMRRSIINNVLGPSGIFRRRKSTVFWISSDGKFSIGADERRTGWTNGVSVHFMHLADQVLTIENSQITLSYHNKIHHDHDAEYIANTTSHTSAKEVHQSNPFHGTFEFQEPKVEKLDSELQADTRKHIEHDSVYRK